MNDELMHELARMEQYAAMLQGLLKEADATAPQRTQAEDSSGAVNIVLDAAGLPERMDVSSDWPRRVKPDALGAAVLNAFGQASESRVQDWSRTLEGGEWGDKMQRAMREDSVEQFTTPLNDVPAMFRRDTAPVQPRRIDELAEEMMREMDRVDEIAADSPLVQHFEGTNRTRTVTVKLNASGLTGCDIDANWAADQSGGSIAHALNEALTIARDRLRDHAGAPTAQGRLDALFAETMALMNDPRRMAES
ncbi:hypothetical protein AB0M47_08405 [Hamadaea sp. NPDC051192]|uniref:hypothetical protein n=1 Tax=Hamadaea sp. NPDC051192 TaxID=3154940 RepID=UPI0034429C3A